MGQIVDSLVAVTRSARALVRRPAFWLALQMLVVWQLSAAMGDLEPHRVADTESYINAANSSTAEHALSRIRTYGYPLFLKQFSGVEGRVNLGRVPAAQRLAFFAAVFFFWCAFSRFSGGPWLAFAAATILLYSPITYLARRIQPDFLAGAFVIAAIASLMLLTVRRTASWWIALAITLFASYQLRSAGVFLIGLVPALGWVYDILRNGRSPREGLTFAALLALVCVIPFLAFATLRWVTVGHFGLVSFGGLNASGMASCFLDEPLLEELPEEHQGLARGILRARQRAHFEPMGLLDDPLLWFDQYGPNMFSISKVVAESQLRREAREWDRDPTRGPPPKIFGVEANRRLGALAREIVKRRWRHYRRWVGSSFHYGFVQLDDWPSLSWPLALLVPSFALALVAGAARNRIPDAGVDTRARALGSLAITAVSFFLAYLLIVSLVSVPFARYFVSLVLFLPPLFAALLFETWRLILEPFVDSSRGG